MSKSLIRKNQLHPDINDLVGQYGSGFFASNQNVVTTTGNQTINGLKNFTTRPTVNGIDVVLSQEVVNVDINNITGNFIFNSGYNAKLLTINATQTITGTVATGLPTGYNVSFIQMNSGQLFITGQTGIGATGIIRQRLNVYTTAGQYAIASLIHHSGNQFILYGDLG